MVPQTRTTHTIVCVVDTETTFINDANINGTAINFNEFIKIVPKSLIQFITNIFPPSKFKKNRPNRGK